MEKVYVEVESRRYGKGYKPLRIKWPDGRVWEIERTLYRCIPSNNEYEGIRYTVIIGSAEKYIYQDGSRWYVEPIPVGGDGSEKSIDV